MQMLKTVWNKGIKKNERKWMIGISMNMRRQRRDTVIREKRPKKGQSRG